MNYVGIDWAYGRAAWCAMNEGGAIAREGMVPADLTGRGLSKRKRLRARTWRTRRLGLAGGMRRRLGRGARQTVGPVLAFTRPLNVTPCRCEVRAHTRAHARARIYANARTKQHKVLAVVASMC
jgi:hypothetical protein